ncbi:(2Fe-2S) ferredoxin domain-containing protein [Paenibacillus harenae]|uniref:(2Fe-2S) ferredoxin domain-containing protein n=1 Tax=Paenibacillus harenae TaxID=306543 RepID=UPI000412FFD9|nr:(2Fe-2S) ferredoxin domain-containing protein [Paenibacillus harenae]
MNHKIVICSGKMCVKQNGENTLEALAASMRNEVEQLGLGERVAVEFGKCMRACRKGCVVTAQPEMDKYFKVTPETGREIVNALSQSSAVSAC